MTQIPTSLDTAAAADNGFAEEETVLEETAAESLPFLRIVADYPVDHDRKDTGTPMRLSVELNVGDVDETDESRADLSEIPSAGFIRLVTDTIGAMRYSDSSTPQVVVNYAGNTLDAKTIERMAERAARVTRFGQRPMHHDQVVATVFGRTVHAPGCDGACGLGAPSGEPGDVIADDVLPEPAGAEPATEAAEPAADAQPSAEREQPAEAATVGHDGGDRKDDI